MEHPPRIWQADDQARQDLSDPRLGGVYRRPDLIWRESLIPKGAVFVGVISRLDNLLVPIHVREAHLIIQDPNLENFLRQLGGPNPIALLARLTDPALGEAHRERVVESENPAIDLAAQYFAANQEVFHRTFQVRGTSQCEGWNQDVTRLEGLILRMPRIKLGSFRVWEQQPQGVDGPDTVWYTDTPLLDHLSLSGTVLRCGLPELAGYRWVSPRIAGGVQAIQVSPNGAQIGGSLFSQETDPT